VTGGFGWLPAGAGTLNGKGVMDRYRRPELAYEVAQHDYRNTGNLNRLKPIAEILLRAKVRFFDV
jgi:hypothetical protein